MKKNIIVLCLFYCSNLFAQNKTSVVTQHNNLYRTGWNDKETILNPVNVATVSFGLTGSLAVDDQVYAQPLVVHQLTINSFSGSVVFVATVNNSVYAFNADDVSYGAPLWQTNLSPSGQRAPNIFDLQDAVNGKPCGGNYRDFSGNMGIVGTPVIDTNSNTLYVVTKTIDAAGNFYQYLNAIDIATGLHKEGSPKKIVAAVNGNGAGSVNNVLNYDAKYANQRPALLLFNNTVYIASASHCDWGPYHGWVLGYDATSLNLKYTYNTTPNGWAGGIWMAGQGISVGDDGNLYLATGNGTTSADNNNMIDGRSESLVKLSPQLQLLDWFTPENYQYLDNVDLDYGCDGALIIPNSSITISGSKEGISYVVDYNNMGRLTAGNAQVVDTLEFNPVRTGYVHIHGSPVYAKLGTNEFVYAWAETFKMRQFTFDRTNNTFNNNFKQGTRNLDNGMPGAMLSISSNNNDAASGIVWACFPFNGNANNQVRPGTIAAYSAADVSSGEIWNSDMNVTDALGKFAKFNSPTVANGKVYAPTFSNELKVYGLKCNAVLTTLTYGNGSGLKGEYFTNSNASAGFDAMPAVSRLDEKINFNWGSGSPAAAVSNDVFKARWTGKLRPLTNDTYTFYVTASDGVRLYVNNQLLINSWADKPITTSTAQIALQKNIDYDIRLEYYSNTAAASCILQWSAAGICKQNIPSSQLFAATAICSSDGTGLKAEYFSNNTPPDIFPTTATTSATVPQVNFNWGGGSPAGISNDNFKARFTGYVQTLDAGAYTFYVTADDGIRLWVNGQLLIDKWINQGATEYSATLNLEACKKYAIKIEYYENGGDAVCKLEWSGPVISRKSIPTAQLSTQPDFIITKEFTVFPNPATESITVSSNTPFAIGETIGMYNMLGQLIKQVNISGATQGSNVTIPVKEMAAGVYVLRLFREGKKHALKVLIKK